MSEWLGHRDLCPIAWGGICDCPCSSIACPGVDRCRAVKCAPITGLNIDTEPICSHDTCCCECCGPDCGCDCNTQDT